MQTRSYLTFFGKPIAWAALTSMVGLILISGCSDGRSARSVSRAVESFDSAYTPAPMAASSLRQVGLEQASGGVEAKAAPAPKAIANRKIIYDARVELVTEDLNKLEAGLLQIVGSQGAYVADSDRSGTAGATRHGTWKIRVPVDAYDALVRGVVGLGELISNKTQSQDVSAEYYDLDARQAAKKVEEARLLKHLADSTGRLDEILAVERELSRVRSEIEQMQGRLAVLSNLTSLATVTVTASEIKGYIPPQAPTLGQKVARTFAGSVESLQILGEAVLLATVALIPWVPLMIPAAILVLVALRRAIRRTLAYLAATANNPPRTV